MPMGQRWSVAMYITGERFLKTLHTSYTVKVKIRLCMLTETNLLCLFKIRVFFRPCMSSKELYAAILKSHIVFHMFLYIIVLEREQLSSTKQLKLKSK